jgi:hypothetical protein
MEPERARGVGILNGVTGRRCTVVIEGRDGGGAGAALPFDPKAAFGRARALVRVTVGGTHTFRTTVAIYGGTGWIGFRKSQLAELGLQVGDQVDLLVELDEQPREVELPTELAEALASDPEAAAAFDALSSSHRKEYAQWVDEAKRSPTRNDRAAKSVQRLRAGTRMPR